jgi:hypothetical protein
LAPFQWTRGLLTLLQGLIFFLYLMIRTPFYRRVANSVYGGFVMARITVSIVTLVDALANTNNVESVGIGLSVTSLVCIPIGFALGFIIIEVFTRVCMRVFNNYEHYLHEGQEKKVKLFILEMTVRFSAGDIGKMEYVEKIVKLASFNNIEHSRLYMLLGAHNAAIASYSYASMWYNRAAACSIKSMDHTTLLQLQYDLDYLLGDKKRISKMIEQGKFQQEELQRYIRLFFKNLVGEAIDNTKLNTYAECAHEREQECDRIFKQLYADYPKDPNILRVYASYLDEVKRDSETAALIFQQADEQEEIEQTRNRRRQRSMDDQDQPQNPPSPTNLLRKKKRAVTPLESSSSFKKYAPTEELLKVSDSVKMSETLSKSDSSGFKSEQERRKELLLRQIHKKDQKILLRIPIYLIGAVLIAWIIIAGAVLSTDLKYLSTDELYNGCNNRVAPYLALMPWKLLALTQSSGMLRNTLDINRQFYENFTLSLTTTRLTSGTVRYNTVFNTPLLVSEYCFYLYNLSDLFTSL